MYFNGGHGEVSTPQETKKGDRGSRGATDGKGINSHSESRVLWKPGDGSV